MRERVPREADGRGLRGLGRADGALPGGRGDRPRGDRGRAEGGHQPRQDIPGRVRRGDAQPRHLAAAGRDRRGPALARQARVAQGRRASSCWPTPSAELFAYVFKTRADPFAGRINLLRVYQGMLRADSHVLNTRAHAKERIGQLDRVRGQGDGPPAGVRSRRHRRRRQAQGDPCRGLAGRAREPRSRCPRLKLPAPVMAFAVEADDRGDEEKVFAALRRLQEEDPTIDLHRDPQTGEQIVAGLSQVHVEVIVERLRERFGVEVALKPPRVPYQETIRARRRRTAGTRSSPAGAASSATVRSRSSRCAAGRGVRVRQPDQGRGDPQLVHPRRREGRARGDGRGRARRLSRQGRARAPVRRRLPQRGLLGDRVQARRRPGDEARRCEQADPVLLEPIMLVTLSVPEAVRRAT